MRKLSSETLIEKEAVQEKVVGIKSIIISDAVHQKLKRHCMGKKLRIGPFVEMLILSHIDKKKTDEDAESTAPTNDEHIA